MVTLMRGVEIVQIFAVTMLMFCAIRQQNTTVHKRRSLYPHPGEYNITQLILLNQEFIFLPHTKTSVSHLTHQQKCVITRIN